MRGSGCGFVAIAMEKYENLGMIGEGSYGMVMKCRHKVSRCVCGVCICVICVSCCGEP